MCICVCPTDSETIRRLPSWGSDLRRSAGATRPARRCYTWVTSAFRQMEKARRYAGADLARDMFPKKWRTAVPTPTAVVGAQACVRTDTKKHALAWYWTNCPASAQVYDTNVFCVLLSHLLGGPVQHDLRNGNPSAAYSSSFVRSSTRSLHTYHVHNTAGKALENIVNVLDVEAIAMPCSGSTHCINCLF